jgi:hypothetical protein
VPVPNASFQPLIFATLLHLARSSHVLANQWINNTKAGVFVTLKAVFRNRDVVRQEPASMLKRWKRRPAEFPGG